MTLLDAVYSRLASWGAGITSPVPVHRLDVPGKPTVDETGLGRYLVVFPVDWTRRSDTANGRATAIREEVQVTYVAWLQDSLTSPDGAAQWLRQQVSDLLIDWVPALDGLVGVAPIQHSGQTPPRRDTTVADRKPVVGADRYFTVGSLI